MTIRRDTKNRRLLVGESQDKTGRYVYKYKDLFGKRKAVYSWRLTETDPYPKGKRRYISLREKEKAILRDLNDGIMYSAGNMTVLDLVKYYVEQKQGVKHNTRANYNFVINILAKEAFGAGLISSVKLSEAKAWLIKL